MRTENVMFNVCISVGYPLKVNVSFLPARDSFLISSSTFSSAFFVSHPISKIFILLLFYYNLREGNLSFSLFRILSLFLSYSPSLSVNFREDVFTNYDTP